MCAPSLALALPDIDIPDINIPDIDIPEVAFPKLNLPELNLPDIDVPKLNLPNSLPSLSVPDLDFSDSLSGLVSIANQLQFLANGAIAHPFWAIALIILTITLIQLAADLIKRVVKAVLAFVLKLPFLLGQQLSQWIWKKAIASSQTLSEPVSTSDELESDKLENNATSNASANAPDINAQARQLITRLETLREEQDQIIVQLKTILAQQPQASAQPAETEDLKSKSTVSPEVG